MSGNLEQINLIRNNQEEINKNYTKIYDLSKIDSLKNITPQEKYLLLCTIKKVLLCTKYFNNNYLIKKLFQDILFYVFTYIIYYILLYPLFLLSIVLEEQRTAIINYTFIKKFIIYFTIHSFKIIINLFENIFLLIKVQVIFLNYAKNEINKMKNNFTITIDSNTYDLTIKKNKSKYKNENKSNNHFFQYIICLPGIGDVFLDEKLLTEKEIDIYNDAKENIEANQMKQISLKKHYFYSIIIGIYIVSFYFLTFGQIKEYIISIIFIFLCYFVFDYFYLKTKFDAFNRESDYNSNKMNIKDGYIVNTNNYVIEIFKLNKIHEEEGNNFDKVYFKYLNEIEMMHEEIINIINFYDLVKFYF